MGFCSSASLFRSQSPRGRCICSPTDCSRAFLLFLSGSSLVAQERPACFTYLFDLARLTCSASTTYFTQPVLPCPHTQHGLPLLTVWPVLHLLACPVLPHLLVPVGRFLLCLGLADWLSQACLFTLAVCLLLALST